MPKKGGRKSKFGRKTDGAKRMVDWRNSKDADELREKNALRMKSAR